MLLRRESFQYAGSVQRYGHTEFIFVKWVPVHPAGSEVSTLKTLGLDRQSL